MHYNTLLNVAIAQLSPVWLNKAATLQKVVEAVKEAGSQKADLIVFGEGFLPGYPFWLSFAGGAQFDSTVQKELYSHYVLNAVSIDKGDLSEVCKIAQQNNIAVYLGLIERAKDRGNHSLYCSLAYIDKTGEIISVHRKLQPTYEERLVWAHGDGNGLQVHDLDEFRVGGLNCWENWMPLVRAGMYAQGENVRVAVWPGSKANTEDITRFVAKEARSFVVSASSFLNASHIPNDLPHVDFIREHAPDMLSDGGSCVAGPNGEWILPPQVGSEQVFYVQLNLQRVLEERQNFDPSGHYSRPDVTKLTVNRDRQQIVHFE